MPSDAEDAEPCTLCDAPMVAGHSHTLYEGDPAEIRRAVWREAARVCESVLRIAREGEPGWIRDAQVNAYESLAREFRRRAEEGAR